MVGCRGSTQFMQQLHGHCFLFVVAQAITEYIYCISYCHNQPIMTPTPTFFPRYSWDTDIITDIKQYCSGAKV